MSDPVSLAYENCTRFSDAYIKAGLAKSQSEFNRLVKEGAIRYNDIKLIDPYAKLCKDEGHIFLIQKSEDTFIIDMLI